MYKKGKFSATEEAQLVAAIERYRVVSAQGSQKSTGCMLMVRQTRSLSQQELDQIIFSNKLGKEKGHETFWAEISE